MDYEVASEGGLDSLNEKMRLMSIRHPVPGIVLPLSSYTLMASKKTNAR